MTKKKKQPAVAYIRKSSDKQEDYPERQRGEIEKAAERHGFTITEWYEDHGLTGTDSANRPEFQWLLKDADDKKFAALFTFEWSRVAQRLSSSEVSCNRSLTVRSRIWNTSNGSFIRA